MSILLRKLTEKSTINFGKYKKETVLQLLSMKKEKDLVAMYFKLSTISFTDEVLNTLGITEEYRIDKPGKNLTIYNLFLAFKFGPKKKPLKQLLKMKKETTAYSKAQLARFNQGHR